MSLKHPFMEGYKCISSRRCVDLAMLAATALTSIVPFAQAGDRIRAWRDGFLAQALEYLERHVRPRLGNDDPEVRRRWAQSMKPSGRKRPPYSFYFKDPEKRTVRGFLFHDFEIIVIYGYIRDPSCRISSLSPCLAISELPRPSLQQGAPRRFLLAP
jgi:hypothetical protein